MEEHNSSTFASAACTLAASPPTTSMMPANELTCHKALWLMALLTTGGH